MRVRGQGHWPTVRRLFSSISTITTGRCGRVARLQHLEQVEDADPKFLERQRIGDPQRGERDKQNKGKCARKPEFLRRARKPCHR